MDESPQNENIVDIDAGNSKWNKVVKSAIAWVILILLGTTVWKMAEPTLPKKPHIVANQEDTSTIISPLENSKPKDGSQNISLPSGTDRVQVTASALNVRAEPGLKSDKVTTLSKGTVVQVLGRSGSWIKIKTTQGGVGYIKASPELIRVAP